MTGAVTQELEQYLAQLGAAHGFTRDQLEANRGGQLHATQLARAGRGLVSAVIWAILGGAAIVGGLVGAALFKADLRPPISSVDQNAVYAIGAGGLVVGGAFLAAAALTLRSRARRRAAYAVGRPETLEGPLAKTLIRNRSAGDLMRIEVQRRHFFVSRRTFELLTQGASYRLYCVGGDLLSVEPSRTR